MLTSASRTGTTHATEFVQKFIFSNKIGTRQKAEQPIAFGRKDTVERRSDDVDLGIGRNRIIQ